MTGAGGAGGIGRVGLMVNRAFRQCLLELLCSLVGHFGLRYASVIRATLKSLNPFREHEDRSGSSALASHPRLWLDLQECQRSNWPYT